MVELLTYLILLIVYGLIIGAMSFYIAFGLDRMMDYGGVFDFIRWNAFKKYAKKIGREELIAEADNPVIVPDDELSIGTQIANWRHNYYTIVVAYSKKFKMYICVECMSVRISLFFNLIAAAYIAYAHGSYAYLTAMFPFTIASTAVIYFLIHRDE